jgi:hypothetical protein
MKQAAGLQDVEVPMLLPYIKISTGADYTPIRKLRLQRFLDERWDYSLAAWMAFAPPEAKEPEQPAAPTVAKAAPAAAKTTPTAKVAPAGAKAAPGKAAPAAKAASPKASGPPRPPRKQATQ